MSFSSIGDLAQSFQLRRDNARLNTDLQRLVTELSSGKRADMRTAVSGDYGPLAGIDASLARNTAFQTGAKEVAILAQMKQTALGQIQDNISALSSQLLLSQNIEQPAYVNDAAATARGQFQSMVSALNGRIGDQTLFAGAATDRPALAPAETMLAELATLAAGETTAAGVEAVLDTWFGPGGGFEATGYLGSTAARQPQRLSEDITANLDTTAADPAIRETLKGFAMAALLDTNVLPGPADERATLARRAGEVLISSETGFVSLRGRLGNTEERIDQALSQLAAEDASLQIARSTITDIDPFRTATELQLVETQLQTLYTLTSRLSRLSLTEFLR